MQVICARRRSDLQAELYRRLRQHKIDQTPAWLVVPEQFTLESERDLLKALQMDVLFDIRVKSFGSMTREVLQRQGGIRRPVITILGQVMVLSQIFDDLKEDLALFQAAREDQGFLEAMAETLQRFKADGIKPEDLQSASDRLEDKLLSQKLDDLSKIYDAYEAKIEGHFIDSESRLDLLVEKLEAASWMKNITFYFDGFLSLSLREIEVLKALDDLGLPVVLFLPLEPGLLMGAGDLTVDDFEAFDAPLAIYRKLQKKIENLSFYPLKESPHPHPGLKGLGRTWFSYRSKVVRDASGISVLQAQNPEDATMEIAMRIRAHIQLCGGSYRDFRILVTDEMTYMPLIQRTFESLSIPIFLDRKPVLYHNPFVRTLVDLLDAVANDMAHEGVFQWLKSPFSSADLSSAQAFETYVRRRRLRGKMIFDEKYYILDDDFYLNKPKQAELAQDELNRLSPAKESLAFETRSVYDLTRSKQTVRTFAQVIADFFSSSLLKNLDHYLIDLQKNGQQALFEESGQVLDILSDLLNQMVELMGDLSLTFSQFVAFFLEGIRSSKVGLIPPAIDQISVGILGRTRWNQTQYLIILGMNESMFPSKSSLPELLTEDEVGLVNSQGLDLIHQKKQTAAEERIAFFNALDGTQKELLLSWELMDLSGGTQQPAQVVRKAILAIETSHTGKHISTLNRTFDQSLYLPQLAYANAVAELRLDPNQAHHKGVFTHGVKGLGPMTIKKTLYTQKRMSRLSAKTARNLYVNPFKMSASQLENFRACPYKHFVAYGLRPKEEEAYDIDAREYGRLLHNSADAFSLYLRTANKKLTESDIDDWMDKYFDAQKNKMIDDQRARGPQNAFMLFRARKQALAAAKAVYHQLDQGAFEVYGEEMAFGDRQSLPALALGDTGVRIEGRIDRVDFYQGADGIYYRIIDYKTSGKTMNPSRLYHALDAQLLIYLASVLQSDETSKPAGVFYMPLTVGFEEVNHDEEFTKAEDRYAVNGLRVTDSEALAYMGQAFAEAGRKAQALTTDQFTVLIRHIISMLSESAIQILEGQIDARPIHDSERSACLYCDYKNICRFEFGERDDRFVRIMTLTWSDLPEKLEDDLYALY